ERNNQNVFFLHCEIRCGLYLGMFVDTYGFSDHSWNLPIHSVGRPKHVRILAGAVEGDVFIGRKAQELRGLLKIRYPLEHGIVTDWDDMERIWQYIYSEELRTLSEEACPPFCCCARAGEGEED